MGADQRLAAGPGRSCRGNGQRQSVICGGGVVPLPRRPSVAGLAGAFWSLEGRAYALQPVGGKRGLETGVSALGRGRRQRIRDDRQHDCPCSSAPRRRSKKEGGDQAIGRSKGGRSTKIHATVDALGNP